MMLCLVLQVVATFSCIAQDIIHEGEYGYSTYYEGTGPLIIMSHHNGALEPSQIPNREPGCWNGQECIWQNGCSPQDASNCGITTVTDSYTKDLATCIYNNVMISNDFGDNFKAHLIINELRRTKLDPNRQIGEAAQGDSRARQTWTEIHGEWAGMAKEINVRNCGFGGLLIDIHGQGNNAYINLGYRLTRTEVNLNDYELTDKYLQEISIRSNIVDNGVFIADAIRGDYSLGSMLSTYGYDAIPSAQYPTIPEHVGTYFAGSTVSTLANHGSQNTDSVTDAIQVEISQALRFDDDIREQFCVDFSRVIEGYLDHWYNINECWPIASNVGSSNGNNGGIGVWYVVIIGLCVCGVLSMIAVIVKWFKINKINISKVYKHKFVEYERDEF